MDKVFDAKYTTYKGNVELTGGRGRFNASDVEIEEDVAVIREEDTVTVIELESASV